MRRVAIIALSAALFAIPAYAVVNFQTGKGKDDKVISLLSDGANDGTGSSLPGFGSDSWIPWPGSDSRPPFPGSGSSSLPGSVIPSVPESSTWLMLVFGFFSVGAIRYRSVRRARKIDSAQQQDQA